jgi:peptidyl-prolyl cis-trans isomerase A (cyclophilin A)
VSEANNGLKNLRGTIAMARQTDPDSATSQFYLNLADNPGLDFGSSENPAGYTVFGKVISGQEVVDEIGIVPVKLNPALGLTHQPVTNVGATQIR